MYRFFKHCETPSCNVVMDGVIPHISDDLGRVTDVIETVAAQPCTGCNGVDYSLVVVDMTEAARQKEAGD